MKTTSVALVALMIVAGLSMTPVDALQTRNYVDIAQTTLDTNQGINITPVGGGSFLTTVCPIAYSGNGVTLSTRLTVHDSDAMQDFNEMGVRSIVSKISVQDALGSKLEDHRVHDWFEAPHYYQADPANQASVFVPWTGEDTLLAVTTSALYFDGPALLDAPMFEEDLTRYVALVCNSSVANCVDQAATQLPDTMAFETDLRGCFGIPLPQVTQYVEWSRGDCGGTAVEVKANAHAWTWVLVLPPVVGIYTTATAEADLKFDVGCEAELLMSALGYGGLAAIVTSETTHPGYRSATSCEYPGVSAGTTNLFSCMTPPATMAIATGGAEGKAKKGNDKPDRVEVCPDSSGRANARSMSPVTGTVLATDYVDYGPSLCTTMSIPWDDLISDSLSSIPLPL